MMTDHEIEQELARLAQTRRVADNFSRAIHSCDMLDADERAELDQHCMITCMSADVRIQLLLDEWQARRIH